MNVLKKKLADMGLTAATASRLYKLPYHALFKQCKGQRTVGVRCAIRYEKVLGIPRWELRPDLWDPPAEAQAEESGAEAQA